jgi:hypothetical protein
MVSREAPEPARATWTDADFDSMSWHDVALHAIAFEPSMPYPGRLLLDIDYIVGGEQPAPPETTFTFWMCPATLVFEHASDFAVNLDLVGRSFEPAFNAFFRSEPDANGDRTWTLAGHEFTMQVRGPGFTQYLRHLPMLAAAQRLGVAERGGISFDEAAFR